MGWKGEGGNVERGEGERGKGEREREIKKYRRFDKFDLNEKKIYKWTQVR